MQVIEIAFDGGCRPTNPGNKYGSYSVQLDGEKLRIVNKQELGRGTNNEAEFETLILALEWTLQSLLDYSYDPKLYHLRIWTDSMIVKNRLNGRNKANKSEPQRRMFNLATRCRMITDRFMSMDILWKGREHNVALFGH